MPDRDRRPTLILTGGFLGAGKTTLLLRAARLLQQRGMRPAIITNDQGGSLVDTRMAEEAGLDAGEVAGACFCCRFEDFIGAAQSLLATEPDVIFAEPVGSCMDLSATVLQPLKQYHGDQFRLAPYSVLADPHRAATMLQPDADPLVSYLFRNQLAEADLVVFTKSDLYPEAPGLPGVTTRYVSARTGAGVAEWLDEMLSGRLRAGGQLLDIDYDRYAAAEAALGWLNWEGELCLASALSPAQVVGPLLDRLDEDLTSAGAAIAHLKVFDRTSGGFIKAGICANGEKPSVEGDLLASSALRHELVVNLRARALPEVLREAVARAMGEFPGTLEVRLEQAFQPSPPVPEHRFRTVV